MAVSITIRSVPDEVRDELAGRAALSGRSLQEYLLGELSQLAARPSAAEALLRARLAARSYPSIDSAEIVAELAHARER